MKLLQIFSQSNLFNFIASRISDTASIRKRPLQAYSNWLLSDLKKEGWCMPGAKTKTFAGRVTRSTSSHGRRREPDAIWGSAFRRAGVVTHLQDWD